MKSLWIGLLLLPLAGLGAEPPSDAVDAKAAFARLHQLEGTWVDANNPEQVVSIWAVTAGGSALTEHLFPGQEHEMLSVYHLIGEALHMTHYCMLGNQPKMKAGRFDDTELVWEFAGGTNLDPTRDQHVHAGTVTFHGADKITSSWEFWAEGKQAGVENFEIVRARK